MGTGKSREKGISKYSVILASGKARLWTSYRKAIGAQSLRVHCAAQGWPIVGDDIYGTAPRFRGPVLHLHAREIVVPISKNKPPVRVTAPVPAHMRERLASCGWNGEAGC
jgi:tRNA pseudouridine32 synthase/23S rRNA pseudouridine746 synthase